MRAKVKNTAIRIGRAINRFVEMGRLPFYAGQYGLYLHRLSATKWVVSQPHTGTFNGNEEIGHTLSVVTESLKSADIDYFVIPSKAGRISVAVTVNDRHTVLDLLAQNSKLAGYYIVIQKEKRNLWIHRLLTRSLSWRDETTTLAVSIYRNIGDKGQRIIMGEPYAVTLEFWSRPEDLSARMKQKAMSEAGIIDESVLKGAIVAPIANGVAKVVAPEEQTRVEVEYFGDMHPTLALFERTLLDKVNFPIDIVYTWVDDADSRWLKKYETARKALDSNFKNNSAVRYTNHDELKYSLRSVEMFAPWVRHIYIVTDGQTPSWLNSKASQRVKIVDHKDIFADPKALPVFNSHAIESQLHRIPGLSEHYLYLNDDMFFASPTSPETFFFANGIAKIQPSSATIGTGAPTEHETAPSSAGKNARKIVEDTFGVYATSKFRHTAFPLLKSVSEQVASENQALIDQTMCSKFRAPTDIPFTSVLMQSYMLASGRGVSATYPSTTIDDLSKPEAVAEIDHVMRRQDLKTFCLNEVSSGDEEPKTATARMQEFLDAYYPYPASWEG